MNATSTRMATFERQVWCRKRRKARAGAVRTARRFFTLSANPDWGRLVDDLIMSRLIGLKSSAPASSKKAAEDTCCEDLGLSEPLGQLVSSQSTELLGDKLIQ